MNLISKLYISILLITFHGVSYSMEAPEAPGFPIDLRINNPTNNSYVLTGTGSGRGPENIKKGLSNRKIFLTIRPTADTGVFIIYNNLQPLLTMAIERLKLNNRTVFHLASYAKQLNIIDSERIDFDPAQGQDQYLIQLNLKGENLQDSNFEVIAVQK